MREFKDTLGYPVGTCLSAQDRYKEYSAYFLPDQDVPVKKQKNARQPVTVSAVSHLPSLLSVPCDEINSFP
jgi:hypothetical protein